LAGNKKRERVCYKKFQGRGRGRKNALSIKALPYGRERRRRNLAEVAAMGESNWYRECENGISLKTTRGPFRRPTNPEKEETTSGRKKKNTAVERGKIATTLRERSSQTQGEREGNELAVFGPRRLNK